MQIIGHQEQCERLLKLNKIPHAMLFTGPEAIGKKRIARWYAQKLLGSIQHPDLHLIEKDPEKRDIPAAELRELIHKLQLKSYAGGKKIAIINDAHELSHAASNAFLKTLEEPPGDSLIILISHCPQMLLPTIISRCQNFNFNSLSLIEIKQILESLEIDGIELNKIIKIGDLSILGISKFVDPLTLEIKDKKKALNHLNQFIDNYNDIKHELQSIWEAEDFESRLNNKVNTASKLAEKKDSLELIFYIIKLELRTKLRSKPSIKESKKIAEQLLKVLEIEQLTRERSLNLNTQLSALL